MKRNITFFLLLFVSLCGCKNHEKDDKSEDDVDAARNFIQSALKGDYQKARTYMLPDSVNEQHMNVVERFNLSPDEKRGLAGASIHILRVANVVKDSVTIIIYSNSFKDNPDTLKVVKLNNQWMVDFKYLYEHDADTIYTKQLSKDSVR
jgi:hypothetical protein